jgi:hypothetical protein
VQIAKERGIALEPLPESLAGSLASTEASGDVSTGVATDAHNATSPSAASAATDGAQQLQVQQQRSQVRCAGERPADADVAPRGESSLGGFSVGPEESMLSTDTEVARSKHRPDAQALLADHSVKQVNLCNDFIATIATLSLMQAPSVPKELHLRASAACSAYPHTLCLFRSRLPRAA